MKHSIEQKELELAEAAEDLGLYTVHPERCRTFINYFLKIRRKEDCKASLQKLRTDLRLAEEALSNQAYLDKVLAMAQARKDSVQSRAEATAQLERLARSRRQ